MQKTTINVALDLPIVRFAIVEADFRDDKIVILGREDTQN